MNTKKNRFTRFMALSNVVRTELPAVYDREGQAITNMADYTENLVHATVLMYKVKEERNVKPRLSADNESGC
jgi:hypothetical protein